MKTAYCGRRITASINARGLASFCLLRHCTLGVVFATWAWSKEKRARRPGAEGDSAAYKINQKRLNDKDQSDVCNDEAVT